MTSYPHLNSPIKVGKFTYRNRIEGAPTIFSSLALVPFLTEKILRMQEDRAKGGCASVVNGEISVNFDDSLRPIVAGEGKMISLKVDYKDFSSPAFAIFQKNAQVIKKHGAVAVAELSHFGIEKPLLEDGIQPLGPVAYTKPDGTPVRAFDADSMAKVANDFAESAAFMQAAGFDGVFVHCGHGWMIGQFLSPRNNSRTDEYGGSIENRGRFPLAILKAIRERCGQDFLIEIRLSGQENLPGGITLEDTVGFCKLLEGTGLVDLIHISAGGGGGGGGGGSLLQPCPLQRVLHHLPPPRPQCRLRRRRKEGRQHPRRRSGRHHHRRGRGEDHRRGQGRHCLHGPPDDRGSRLR